MLEHDVKRATKSNASIGFRSVASVHLELGAAARGCGGGREREQFEALRGPARTCTPNNRSSTAAVTASGRTHLCPPPRLPVQHRLCASESTTIHVIIEARSHSANLQASLPQVQAVCTRIREPRFAWGPFLVRRKARPAWGLVIPTQRTSGSSTWARLTNTARPR